MVQSAFFYLEFGPEIIVFVFAAQSATKMMIEQPMKSHGSFSFVLMHSEMEGAPPSQIFIFGPRTQLGKTPIPTFFMKLPN